MWCSLLFIAACADPDDPPKDTADSADTVDTVDTIDTVDTADTVDTVDTAAVDPVVHIYGVRAYDDVGHTIDVGDVDGDGRDDLLLGTLYAEGQRGGGYLIPGAAVAEGAIDGVAWRIDGDVAGAGAGRSVGLADVDGDGTIDLGFGAPYAASGGVEVLLGPVTGTVSLADSPVTLTGASGSYCGHGMDLGDVDGDGIADGIAGAYGATPNGHASGAVYVRSGPLTGPVDLVTEADAILAGEAPDSYAGRSLRAGDDLDGDGIGDLVIAAPYADGAVAHVGVVYVVHGPAADMDLADADGRFEGEGAQDYVGTTLGRGDVDGDGLADVLAGGWSSAIARYAGAAYIFLGPAVGVRAASSAEIVVYGESAEQYAGTGLAAGRVDGSSALLIGAPGHGAAFLFMTPGPGAWSISDATESWQDSGSELGEGVAFADLDGDGSDELVLGDPGDRTGGAGAGALWVIGL